MSYKFLVSTLSFLSFTANSFPLSAMFQEENQRGDSAPLTTTSPRKSSARVSEDDQKPAETSHNSSTHRRPIYHIFPLRDYLLKFVYDPLPELNSASLFEFKNLFG